MIYKICITLSIFFHFSNYSMMRPSPRVSCRHQYRSQADGLNSSASYPIATLNTSIYKPHNDSRYSSVVVAVQKHFQEVFEKEARERVNQLCDHWKVKKEDLKERFRQNGMRAAFYHGLPYCKVSQKLENKVRTQLIPEFKSVRIVSSDLDEETIKVPRAFVISDLIAVLPLYEKDNYDAALNKHLSQAMGHLAHEDYVITCNGQHPDIVIPDLEIEADSYACLVYDKNPPYVDLPQEVKDFLKKRANIWFATRGTEQCHTMIHFYRKLYPEGQAIQPTNKHQVDDCRVLKMTEDIYTYMSDELSREREGR